MIVATAFLYWLDRVALRESVLTSKRSVQLVAVLVLISLTGFWNVLAGAIFLFLLFYWVMTGRVAGCPGWSLKYFWHSRWDEKLYLVFAVTLLAPALSDTLSDTISRTYYRELPERPGIPAFPVKYKNQMNSDLKRAMRRFPDAQSCLQWGADASRRTDLVHLDWHKISTTGEAEVCIFRLLHGWGGADEAASWLEAQGFGAGRSFNSSAPYIALDGTQRVDGGWSIKTNGPKFPTSGLVRRIRRASPYGMGVKATFSPDGQKLLFVNTDYSTL